MYTIDQFEIKLFQLHKDGESIIYHYFLICSLYLFISLFVNVCNNMSNICNDVI